MGQPFVGEVRLVPYNFAPVAWQFCDGRSIAISENDTLFNLIGTTYGGDGQNTFALPDLRGRTPIQQGTLQSGQTFVIGQVAGVETVTLSTQQMPAHSHLFIANSATSSQVSAVVNNTMSGGVDVYQKNAPGDPMAPGTLTMAGGSQPHDNMQPYLTLNWIISLFGIYPTQG